MQDDQKAPSDQKGPDRVNGDSTKDFVGVLQGPRNPEPEGNSIDKQVEEDVKALQERVKKAEKWMIALTGAMALFALCQVVAGLLQWNVMKAQLAEMRTGSVDTHTLAIDAGRQAKWTQHLTSRMKDLAGATQAMARQAVVQADAAKLSADAAESTARTAEESLHMSERAYIVMGAPRLVAQKKLLVIPLINKGRIPSGEVDALYHVELVKAKPDGHSANFANPLEIYWHMQPFQTINPSVPVELSITLVKMDPTLLEKSNEGAFVAGNVSYSDGFDDTQRTTVPICVQTYYRTDLKQLMLIPCDSKTVLPQIEAADEYPKLKFELR